MSPTSTLTAPRNLALVALLLPVSCGGPSSPASPPVPPSTSASAQVLGAAPRQRDSVASVEPSQRDSNSHTISSDAGAPAQVAEGGAIEDDPCPSDMIHVEHDFCPKVERSCARSEYNKPNRITLCHRFTAGSTRCLAPRVKLDYCIDKYEYPNREGAHPPWLVSWFDAEATCRSLGKRTCWDAEWVAACEGPDETPFPYGWERDNTKCNIDNLWIEPRLSAAHSRDPQVSLRELSRLDQSVPSGSMKGCVSGFGVFDLTGNMDEWVTRSDRKDKEKSAWAGLKGGAWGHVRNACRPMTTSHPPEFTYYFITFRCCKDPKGKPPFVPPGSSPPPVVAPADKAPIPSPIHPPGPSKQKVQPENRGR